VYRAPIVTPAAYGGKGCNPFLFPLCNTQACDTNVYQNCSFRCNGTDAYFNVSTIQGNASTPEAAGCNITCVTLDPVDCLVSGGEPDPAMRLAQSVCLFLKTQEEIRQSWQEWRKKYQRAPAEDLHLIGWEKEIVWGWIFENFDQIAKGFILFVGYFLMALVTVGVMYLSKLDCRW
jgi:hypothetical protein